ncbi:MAG: sensor histidine kinase [Bacteroidales bacterium]|nr:sensor histidine kinase [Bacteroidales bacterium]
MQINFLEALYQKEKQEREITMLQNEKQINNLLLKRRNVTIVTLIVFMLLLAAISWFIAKSMHQKKVLAEKELQLQKQKLSEIEKQRQLDATLSVLKGEEAERGRMARDLHDGLGGLLSGVKLSLAHAKGNVVLTGDGEAQFDRALSLLDTSMRELRRLAHNMMPEALVKFGLKDAISDFCNSIDCSKGMNIKFQFYGIEKRIDSRFEISIYRIAQELVNNALKYSNAADLLVQLILEDSRVHLTVQDNGVGFDTKILNTTKGAGLSNIRSRVESQSGIFEFYSEPDKGTEASVEFSWQIYPNVS